MNTKEKLRPYWNRFIIVMIISVLFGVVVNELSFLFQKENYDRAPQTVSLVIPAGTAKRIEAGGSEPSIPPEMVFVQGDTLEVKNEDVVSHQLGPIWVPPGATGSLVLKEANNFVYKCSFQPNQYLGIDVRQATTLGIRLTALFLVAPTTAALVYLYSLLIFPIDKPKKIALNGNGRG